MAEAPAPSNGQVVATVTSCLSSSWALSPEKDPRVRRRSQKNGNFVALDLVTIGMRIPFTARLGLYLILIGYGGNTLARYVAYLEEPGWILSILVAIGLNLLVVSLVLDSKAAHTNLPPHETSSPAGRRAGISAATIYSGAAVAFACWVYFGPFGLGIACPSVLRIRSEVAALLVVELLVVGSILSFIGRRFGHLLSLVAACLAWYGFVQVEFNDYKLTNSWIRFNLGDWHEMSSPWLMIAAVAIVALATGCSLLRLAPARWHVAKLPIRDRIWPAFALCISVVASWYLSAVTPYRIPIIVDRVLPSLSVVHVEKHGLHLRETSVSFFRDGKFYVVSDARRLFQYRFAQDVSNGVVAHEDSERIRALAVSPQFRGSPGYRREEFPPYQPPRSWNSDRWFVFIEGVPSPNLNGVAAPTVPKAILDRFYEAQSLPKERTERANGLDVCLGFCYDPTIWK